MTFQAIILNAAKQQLVIASFPTWSEAAKFLCEDKTKGRKFSSVVIHSAAPESCGLHSSPKAFSSTLAKSYPACESVEIPPAVSLK